MSNSPTLSASKNGFIQNNTKSNGIKSNLREPEKVRIYFAHSLTIYGTEHEQFELQLLKKFFHQSIIINPSDYDDIWKSRNYSQSKIMAQCYQLILYSHLVVFSCFKHRIIGKGVYDEIKFAKILVKPVYFLTSTHLRSYSLCLISKDNWKHYCQVFPKAVIDPNQIIFDHYQLNNAVQFIQANNLLIIRDFKPKNVFFNLMDMCLVKKQQLIIITRYNAQLLDLFKDLLMLRNFGPYKNLIVLPVIGKSHLCRKDLKQHPFPTDPCINCHYTLRSNKTSQDTIFRVLENLIIKPSTPPAKILSIINHVTPPTLCPHILIRKNLSQAQVLITNHAFIQRSRMRLYFFDEILDKQPYNKVVIVNDVHSLLRPITEAKLTFNEVLSVKHIISRYSTQSTQLLHLLNRLINMFSQSQTFQPISQLDTFLKKFYYSQRNLTLQEIKVIDRVYYFCQISCGYWKFENKTCFT